MVKIIRQGTAADLEHAVKADAAKIVVVAAESCLEYSHGEPCSLRLRWPRVQCRYEDIDVLYLGEALNSIVDDPDLRSAVDVLKVVHGPDAFGRLPLYPIHGGQEDYDAWAASGRRSRLDVTANEGPLI
jgi:hypothetical protein